MKRKIFQHAVIALAALSTVLVTAQSPAAAGPAGPAVAPVTAADGAETPSLGALAVQGPYRIFSFAAKCVDVPNGNTANVQINQWTCGSTFQANQQWYFEDRDSGYYWIRNRGSRKCLTVLNNSSAQNAPIIQFDCNAGDNEEWIPRYVGTSDQNLDYYRLESRHVVNGVRRCITVQNASTDNAPLLQFTCGSPGSNDLFTWGNF